MGKKAYLDLFEANEDFLGNQIEIHDALYVNNRVCVRYTIRQGDDFCMEVREWLCGGRELIEEIPPYYHIGEIREDRKLSKP